MYGQAQLNLRDISEFGRKKNFSITFLDKIKVMWYGILNTYLDHFVPKSISCCQYPSLMLSIHILVFILLHLLPIVVSS